MNRSTRAFAALTALGLLAACGSSATKAATTSAPASTAPATTAPATTAAPTTAAAPTTMAAMHTTYPLTITQCGRTLTFPSAPTKIVVDGESYALPLFSIGAGDLVKAVFSHDSGKLRPEFDVTPDVAKALQALPSLSGADGHVYPSKEQLVASQTDLIIEAYNGDTAGGDSKGTDGLVAEGFKIFTLSPSCPGSTLDGSFNDTLQLGKILDKQDEAAKLVDTWKQAIADAGAKVKAVAGPTPTVFFLDGFDTSGAIYSNPGGFTSELVAAAGGKLVPANTTPDDIYTVSKEAVVAANPDVVLTYTQDSPPDDRINQLWGLIPTSAAAKTKAYTLVPYPDGAGNVEFVQRLAAAIIKFKTGG